MASPIQPVTGPMPPISAEQRAAASRYVLRNAKSPEDLHLLLDALGLNPTKENPS